MAADSAAAAALGVAARDLLDRDGASERDFLEVDGVKARFLAPAMEAPAGMQLLECWLYMHSMGASLMQHDSTADEHRLQACR